MSEIKDLQKLIVEFRDKRDWEQFHTLKNLAIDLSGEASELLEVFKWSRDDEDKNLMENPKIKNYVEKEVADVFWTILLFAHQANVDIPTVLKKKIKKNEKKYPLDKTKGKRGKWKDYLDGE